MASTPGEAQDRIASRVRGDGGGADPATLAATALTLLWLGLCGAALIMAPAALGAGLVGYVLAAVATLAPVALIWTAAAAVRANRALADEVIRLSASVDALRQAYIARNQGDGQRSPVEQRLEEVLRGQKRLDAAVAALVASGAAADAEAERRAPPGSGPGSPAGPGAAPEPAGSRAPAGRIRAAPAASSPRRAAPAPPKAAAPAEAEQPRLALGTPAEALAPPVSRDDFIRALNFPETESDRDGFRALRLALKDHRSAGLVRSAQDVLTLLAEDGIYMDDLSPDRARPEIWRRFARGERGRTVASLGGVRDRTSLALTAGRMRQDPVFRDAVHHFLRKFDHGFAGFEPEASDADIVALSETRTARAFMLVGRVSGTFD